MVGLNEFHNVLSSDNRTDVVLGYIALVLLGAIGIDVGENSVVGTLRSLMVPSKYPKIPFI